MSLTRLRHGSDLVSPTVVVALDAWVDAGSASTNAAEALVDEHSVVVASFEVDQVHVELLSVLSPGRPDR